MSKRIHQHGDSYMPIVEEVRSEGQQIIFTNGCFDILHAGHVQYLQACKEKNGFLIVGLNSDNSIRTIKGENRPIQSEEDRATILSSLRCVDMVILFDKETPISLIQNIKPDMLIKGGDYEIGNIVGHDIVTQYGGTVITVPLLQGRSSTSIIQKIKKLTL